MGKIYRYNELRGVLKVGDKVRAGNDCNNGCTELGGEIIATIDKIKDNYFYIDGCSHSFDKTEYSLELINNERSNNMVELTPMLNKLLDKDGKVLYKAGYINGDLELTDKGIRASNALLFDTNRKELVLEAQTEIDKAEAKKKKEVTE